MSKFCILYYILIILQFLSGSQIYITDICISENVRICVFMYNGAYALDKRTFIRKRSVYMVYKSGLYSRRVKCIYIQRSLLPICKGRVRTFWRNDVPSWRDLTYSKVHVQNKIIIAREKQIYYRQKYKYLSAKIFQDDNFSYQYSISPFRFVFN